MPLIASGNAKDSHVRARGRTISADGKTLPATEHDLTLEAVYTPFDHGSKDAIGKIGASANKPRDAKDSSTAPQGLRAPLMRNKTSYCITHAIDKRSQMFLPK